MNPRFRLPTPYTFRERWRFRGGPRAANHPMTSFQTRLLGTPSQKWFYIDGILSSVSDVPAVQFMAVYAIALGASDAEIGLISIATGLAGVLALVPGIRIAEITNSRRRVVLWGGSGAARVVLLLIAFAPVFMPDLHAAFWVVVAGVFVRSFMQYVSHPSWVSLLADIIPLDLRRFYVTQRMLAITVAAAVAAPLVGFGIRIIGGVEGYQWLFVASFLIGSVAWYAYFRIQEPARPPRSERPKGSTRGMLRDRLFIRYLLALLLLNTTTMIVGPFLMAYFIRDLGGSVSDVGLLATLEQTAAVGGQFLLGMWVTKFSSERLFRWILFFPALIPALWFVAGEPWHVTFAFAAGGLVWAIYNVAIFNLLMEYAPNENIPRYASVQQIVILFSQLLGPIIGTLIVAAWDIRVAMVVSFVGRLLAAFVMFIPVRWIPAIRTPMVPPLAPGTVTVPAPPPEGGST
ncbi:MAG: MFS transporter [Dehalococcoidia bacterium]|nr:MFS transporter [Dehalococcoidia bacterium]MCB9483807.1 MFS transporter [Dehalococcoidia bacterium]